MNEAGNRQLLFIREAARGLAGDASRGIVGAVRIAPLAPGVIGQVLHHPSAAVGQHRDRAEVIGLEKQALRQCPVRVENAHAHLDIADRDILGPLLRGGPRIQHLRQHAEGRDIKRGSFRRHLLEAPVLGERRGAGHDEPRAMEKGRITLTRPTNLIRLMRLVPFVS